MKNWKKKFITKQINKQAPKATVYDRDIMIQNMSMVLTTIKNAIMA